MIERTIADGPWHPWLRIEQATRAVLGARLTNGATEAVDQALAVVMIEQETIARAGWF